MIQNNKQRINGARESGGWPDQVVLGLGGLNLERQRLGSRGVLQQEVTHAGSRRSQGEINEVTGSESEHDPLPDINVGIGRA